MSYLQNLGQIMDRAAAAAPVKKQTRDVQVGDLVARTRTAEFHLVTRIVENDTTRWLYLEGAGRIRPRLESPVWVKRAAEATSLQLPDDTPEGTVVGRGRIVDPAQREPLYPELERMAHAVEETFVRHEIGPEDRAAAIVAGARAMRDYQPKRERCAAELEDAGWPSVAADIREGVSFETVLSRLRAIDAGDSDAAEIVASYA